MNEINAPPAHDWEQIRPLLDEALDRLGQADRDALMLRFFEQSSLAEVGRRLGLTEDATRKRVNRALDKLRTILVRRGLITTAAILSAVISTHAVQLAPAGLAAKLASASLASAAKATGITFAILKIMSLTKAQISVGATAVALLTASLIIQHQSQIALRQENDTLRRQLAQLNSNNQTLAGRLARSQEIIPRLPVPAIQPVISSNLPADTMQSTNFYERLKNKDTKLSLAQLDAYLKSSGRNAASLLAAYRTTKDPALLAEAMQNFPNDPQVAFEAALSKDLPADQRRQWLDTLEKSDSDNALGNYLSALNYFQAGQSDQAIKEMQAAASKTFEDYTSQRYQDDTEAYIAAGYSVADAKAAAGLQLLLPQLQQVKDLGLDMVNLAKTYQQQGDTVSAQAALQMAVNLGDRYSNPAPGEPVISQLVGIALERIALGNMDPAAQYGSSGQTVQDYRNQLQQQQTQLYQWSDQVESLLPQMSEQDWIIYRDRWLTFGEQNAEQWVISKFAQK